MTSITKSRKIQKEPKPIEGEEDKDINVITGQESNLKYLEIYENSNKTSKPQGRTLSTIAGIFEHKMISRFLQKFFIM